MIPVLSIHGFAALEDRNFSFYDRACWEYVETGHALSLQVLINHVFENLVRFIVELVDINHR